MGKKINKYASMMKRIIDGFYEKETVLYDEWGGWYSRIHGCNVKQVDIEWWVDDILSYYESLNKEVDKVDLGQINS